MIKRVFDVLLVVVTAPAWMLILLFVALISRVKLGGPVFFVQMRPGMHGHPFELLKFRTMTNARDEAGRLLGDAERMTAFGRTLRSTSLDELPELVNVLRGDMSLVGPRPLLMEYISLYSKEQARRHSVRPGITGWAQINGRNEITWPERFRLDCWYVDHQSFWLDIKILWLTLIRVLQRRGISAASEATMPRFTGDAQ